MATSLLTFRPTGVRACTSSGHRKPDPNSRKTSSSNWWTPLFGWSSDPDYIDDSSSSSSNNKDPSEKIRIRSESDPETARSRSRFAPGCFTEQKAKQLRMKTMETVAFHDIMYHSAIASRLASDLPNRSDL
ncbi:hypothetical protein HHK36_021507 [Tetracentron sinense]|uniref:Uncharacterized protein n=1 Tax=Tetracentron sinense TaxID=13715 RepID=A0A834YUP3_TETSI|nr:hypothetical protein HHK36_021507 [Tetracentron sinense]